MHIGKSVEHRRLSPFIVCVVIQFQMMQEVICLEVCSKTLTEQESNQFVDRIEQDYTVHL